MPTSRPASKQSGVRSAANAVTPSVVPAAHRVRTEDEPEPQEAKDRHYVTALARGLQILRCFTHERPELTPGEIVRMTGLPQPTVWRLCHTLECAGFIVCADEGGQGGDRRSGKSGGRMALGIPALALGYAALVRQDLSRLALPAMRALTEKYRLGTSLAVRDGLEMVYLQRTHGDFIYFNDPVGARRPLATAPTGWACLAGYDDVERAEVLKSLKRSDPQAWPATERHIRAALDEYNQHGFITSIGILHEQFNAVAVPIRGVRGGPVHGLSASGLASLWPRKKLLAIGAELVRLAHELSSVAPAQAD